MKGKAGSKGGRTGALGSGESLSRPRSDSRPSADQNRERTLMGSLTNSYKFKADGLMKKTFSLTIAGVAQHLVSYYKVSDVESGRLRSPSTLPELTSLDISPSLLERGNFRCLPKLEVRFAFLLVPSFLRFFLRSFSFEFLVCALFFCARRDALRPTPAHAHLSRSLSLCGLVDVSSQNWAKRGCDPSHPMRHLCAYFHVCARVG
ncbi:hypothetical protein C8R45DRAFT_354227 [Mycena sanguinolenta]|nr:hypothetical protein C8R45DRAFT_354227 [Mycena sanguinolenta]